MPIILTPKNLSLSEVVAIARDFETVELSGEIRDKLAATRHFIEQNWMNDEAPLIYSFNTGVGLLRGLNRYLETRFPVPFFTRVMETTRVDALLNEATNVVRRWPHQRPHDCREAFDRMHEMQTPEYARERAQEIAPQIFDDAMPDGGGEDPTAEGEE